MSGRALRAVAYLLAAAAAFLGCGSGDEPSGLGVAVHPVGDAHLLWETSLWIDYDIFDSSAPSLAVLDVARDGSRIVVAVRNTFNNIPDFYANPTCAGECDLIRPPFTYTDWLLVSEDLGETWRLVELETPSTIDGGNPLQHWTFSAGVYAAGGHVVHVGGASDRVTLYYFAGFDLDTAEHFLEPALGDLSTPVRPYAVGPFLDATGEWSSPTDRYIYTMRYDARSGDLRSDVLTDAAWAVPEGEFPMADLRAFGTNNGTRWVALSDEAHRSGKPAEWNRWCRAELETDRETMPRRTSCVDRERYPAALRKVIGVHAFPSGMLTALSRWEGHAWALGLASPLVPEDLVDLGEGKVHLDTSMHARFSGALPLQAPDGKVAYLDLLSDGRLERLAFPETPCGEKGCGYTSELVWAQALPEQEWLLFYRVNVVRTRAGGAYDAFDARQYHLYALRWKEQREPWRPEPLQLPSPTSPLAYYPQADPAGSLERACQGVAACTGRRFYDCLGEWQEQRRGCGTRDAFEGVDPEAADACLQWASLRPDPACNRTTAPDAPTCTATANRCEDGALVFCDGAGREGRVDCTALGLTCAVGEDGATRCGEPEPDVYSDCGQSQSSGVECTGDRYLSWCAAFQTRHFVDCTELGHEGCQPAVGDAVCSSTPPAVEGPSPASALERQCWAEVVCNPVPMQVYGGGTAAQRLAQFKECVDRWSSPIVAGKAALAAFLEASPSDCAALAVADPVGLARFNVSCKGGAFCMSEDLVACAYSPTGARQIVSCGFDTGATCAPDARGRVGCFGDASACPATASGGGCDSQGRAFDCGATDNAYYSWIVDCGARGLDCVAWTDPKRDVKVGMCVDPSWSGACPQPGGACVGNTALVCGKESLPLSAMDCARSGRVCDTGYCAAPGQALGQTPDPAVPACDPTGATDRLDYWLGGPRTFDCRDIGCSCARSLDGTGWCVR